MSEKEPITITSEQEHRIAELAAELVIKKLPDEFYKHVGKTFVQRLFFVVLSLVVGFAVAKGWVNVGFSK